MNYLAAHQRAAQRYNGEISSLVVAFRSGGKSFLYKERIEQYKGKVMRDEEQSVRFPLPMKGMREYSRAAAVILFDLPVAIVMLKLLRMIHLSWTDW